MRDLGRTMTNLAFEDEIFGQRYNLLAKINFVFTIKILDI